MVSPRDYYKAIEVVLARAQARKEDDAQWTKKWVKGK
jgi:hypothetical protein